MEPLLERMTAYQQRPRPSAKYTMILTFTVLLLFSSTISLIAFAMKLAPVICGGAHATG
jgi:uncharacterized membrane protein (DUF485 family)